MNADLYLPRQPKQKRSLEKFKKVLNTAEKLLLNKGIHSITLKEIARKANLKRPTLYKFFPHSLSILFALSEKHVQKIVKLFKANILENKDKKLEWYLNLLTDVTTIYLNKNKAAAILILSINQIPGSIEIKNENNKLLTKKLLQLISEEGIIYPREKALIAVEISLAILSLGYRTEGYIGARFVAEAKRASLAYIALP